VGGVAHGGGLYHDTSLNTDMDRLWRGLGRQIAPRRLECRGATAFGRPSKLLAKSMATTSQPKRSIGHRKVINTDAYPDRLQQENRVRAAVVQEIRSNGFM
jgi:hypothetical protein